MLVAVVLVVTLHTLLQVDHLVVLVAEARPVVQETQVPTVKAVVAVVQTVPVQVVQVAMVWLLLSIHL
jgi:hypothetical protein